MESMNPKTGSEILQKDVYDRFCFISEKLCYKINKYSGQTVVIKSGSIWDKNNYCYLDYSGNYVKIVDDRKITLCNIKNMSDNELAEMLLSTTDFYCST